MKSSSAWDNLTNLLSGGAISATMVDAIVVAVTLPPPIARKIEDSQTHLKGKPHHPAYNH
jgi:hypothetical protein